MIYVKRTFHPVGQGAFFTEQFMDDKLEKVLYNVVYDCGSTSKDIDTQITRDIRDCFHEKKEIDVLFLSHFDNDHINYVSYLRKEGHLHGTKIFIPMLEEELWLGIRPYAKNYRSILSYNEDSPGGTKVIQIEPDKGERSDFVERREPMGIGEIKVERIPSGTLLAPSGALHGIIWCYTPFNVHFKTLISVFKEKLKNAGLDYDQLKDKAYVVKYKKELKTIYQNLGEKPSGGTAINFNSLLVMSYPANDDDCRCTGYRCYYERGFCIVEYPRIWRHGYRGSCMYTGDTSVNDQTVWNRIEQITMQYLGKRLELLQVPHHGSKYSYDQKILDSDRFLSGFTNFDPYYRQHIFDESLPMKFATNDKPLILVTRDYASRHEEYWAVEVNNAAGQSII